MKHLFVCIILTLALAMPATGQTGLNKFVFSPDKTKMLPGKTPERGNKGEVKEDDQIGRLGLVSLFYQNSCYTDGRYNHNNFKVVQGTIRSGKQKFDAYKVFAPQRKATKFLASQHCIAFRFPQKKKYVIYTLKANKVDKVAEIKASQVKNKQFTVIKTLKVSRLKGNQVYFFAPANQRISSFKQLSTNTEGSQIKNTPLGKVSKYRFKVKASVFHTGKDYGRNRQFFLLKAPQNKVQMVWQDQKNQRIYLSNFSSGFKSQQNFPLYNPTKAQLIAATNDNQGNIYYCTYQGKKGNTKVAMYKASAKGQYMKTKQYSTAKKELNVYGFGYMATLKYVQGKVALMIGRTMHKSNDGLNHQGGIAVVFDANTLSQIRNHGQTSGHSFDNYLTANQAGQFIAIDLGDNYPRGVNLHRFDGSRRKSQVVYTFKTLHGQRATSPAGRKYDYYAEISRGDKKFYKWSNDNGTYSELGGVAEVSNGYIVAFTGEPSPTGKALDNSRAGYKNPDPRNVGLVKVRKDFEKSTSRGCQIQDDLVLSKGITETGGFYTFGGWFSKQRNAGVKWLTNYRDKSKASARNLRIAQLNNKQILLLWEVTNQQGYRKTYQNTYAMKIDANGNTLVPPVALGEHVRLGRRDDLLVMGNKVLIPAGNGAEGKIELIVIETR